MPRLTARFFIDGQQVDEVDADVPANEDVLAIIKVLKEDVPDTVSSMTAEVSDMTDLTVLLGRKRYSKPGPRS